MEGCRRQRPIHSATEGGGDVWGENGAGFACLHEDLSDSCCSWGVSHRLACSKPFHFLTHEILVTTLIWRHFSLH